MPAVLVQGLLSPVVLRLFTNSRQDNTVGFFTSWNSLASMIGSIGSDLEIVGAGDEGVWGRNPHRDSGSPKSFCATDSQLRLQFRT